MSGPQSSSFAWAIRLLPRQRRQAMVTLYQFCRCADDLADGDAPDKAIQLARYREALQALIQGQPVALPQIAALAPVLNDHKVPADALIAVLDGVGMDVDRPIHAPSWEELELYCQRVAGAVGVAILHILDRKDMLPLAYPLGEALQLTNILRDRDSDAALGRLYLPAPALTAAGIDPQQSVTAILNHPALPDVLDTVARRAEQEFQIAENLLTQRSTARLWPVLIMMRTYRLILERMRCNGFRPIPLSPSRRLWIALCVRMRGFFTS